MPGGTIFLTGGSGFVGSAMIDELISRNFTVNALVDRHPLQAHADRVNAIHGTLFDSPALDKAFQGCSGVIHLVGIIMQRPSKGITFERIHFEGTKNVVDAARRAGVKRFVHMSALGTRPDAISDYHKTKYQAEEYLRQSGLDWTIFRPSLIHGPRGEFMAMEARWARKKAAPFLFMPYFGRGPFGTRGAGNLQPIFVADVARAFVDALDKPQTIGEVYPLGGAEVLTWPQLHRLAAESIIGKRRAVMAVPTWYARFLTQVVPARLLPFNRDQVIMSQEDNTAETTKFKHDFGWEPQGISQTLKTYAPQL
jgi:NADH dehydrogenase